MGLFVNDHGIVFDLPVSTAAYYGLKPYQAPGSAEPAKKAPRRPARKAGGAKSGK